jgi:hypothetical protein
MSPQPLALGRGERGEERHGEQNRPSMSRSTVRTAAAAIPGACPVASVTTLIPVADPGGHLADGLAQVAFQQDVVADHEQA